MIISGKSAVLCRVHICTSFHCLEVINISQCVPQEDGLISFDDTYLQ